MVYLVIRMRLIWTPLVRQPELQPIHQHSYKAKRRMAFCLMWWPPSFGGICRSSSITKWPARISQERLDLESPNLIRTSVPVWSSITPDMMSLTTSGQNLLQKDCWKCRLQWFLVEFLKKGLSEDNKVLPAWYDVASCFRSAVKCS